MVGNVNDDTNIPHKLVLSDRQVSSLCKIFTNNLSANIKLSQAWTSKIIQSGGFLGRLFEPLLTALGKSALIPLGLTAAVSVDARIHEKILVWKWQHW